MSTHCYFNGKFTTLDKVKISPYDLGFLRGYGVFDVMRTENRKPFLLDRHWKRFLNSAKELGLLVPLKKENYQKVVEKLIQLNGFPKSNIRTISSGGETKDGLSRKKGKESFLILIEKFHELPLEFYKKGASVITADYERFFPKAKINNYVVAIKNQEKKLKNKALEIFYLKNGKALEASTSNFFLVKKGKINTTKEKILLGITRNLTLELAKKAGFKIEEREIAEKEIFEADEIFLTATNKYIVPIVRIDGKKVGNGKIGPVTKILMEKMEEFVKSY